MSAERERLLPRVVEVPDDEDISADMDEQVLEAARNDPNEVLDLLSNGANVHATSDEGESVLYLLVSNEKTTVDILLKALEYVKGQTDKSDSQKREALVRALDQKRLRLARILLDNNATISQSREDQEESLNYAVRSGDEKAVRSLLENGAKVNERDGDYGNTPLDNACIQGLTSIAKILLQHKADINAIDFTGSTPLNTACRFNQRETVQLLLENNADPNQADRKGLTPLHTAAKRESEEIVLTLLEYSAQVNKDSDPIKVDPDKVDYDGWTPLHTAVKRGNQQIVSILLKFGVQVEKVDDDGWTPLHTAVKEGNEQIVSMLLEHGVQVDKVDYDGWTPLSIASAWGYQIIADELLKRKAYPNNRSNGGWTPLHLASAFGQDLIVKTLLEHGADIFAEDNHGYTALHLASQQGYHKAVQALLVEKETIHALDKRKWTPLHYASFYKPEDVKLLDYGDDKKQIKPTAPAHDEVVSLLLEAGARIGEKTDKMETALHLATKSKNMKCFQQILSTMKEDDIVARDAHGDTALSLAAKTQSSDMVRDLLKNGNTVNFGTQDMEKETLLWAAEQERTHDIVVMLSKKGKTMVKKDIPEKGSDSALYWVALNGNLDLVWRVLSNSAPNQKANKDREDIENALRAILSKSKENDPLRKKSNADGAGQRDRGETSETDNQTMVQQKDQSYSDTRRNYELILDLIKDPAYVQTSAPIQPCKLPVLDKQKKIEEFEAAVVDFYSNEESSGFYQRFRSVKEVIYDEGPEKIMSESQKWLQNVAEKLNEKVKYQDQDFQFRWIHLPANNLQWMNDLTSRIIYDAKKEEEEEEEGGYENDTETRRTRTNTIQSTNRIQIVPEIRPRKRKQEKYNDLYNFFRRSWHLIPDASSEFRSMKPGCLFSDEDEEDDERQSDNEVQAAIYMPYLVFSAYPSRAGSKYDKLLDCYKDHGMHGFRTLDESYYNFTPDRVGKEEKDHRNRDQVVTKRIYRGKKVPSDEWLLVGVEQLWLWVLDRKTIITSSTHRINDEESTTVRRAVLKELNNIRNGRSGQCQPRSSMDMCTFIVDICILRYERERAIKEGEAINRSIEQFFSDAVNEAAVKESELFQRFTKETEKSGHSRDFIKDAATLLCEVKDIRDELNMLKAIVNCQESIQSQVYQGQGNDFAAEILNRIEEMVKITDRIHEAVNATLALEQNKISMKQSEEAVQQGKKLMAFTIATIIFLPMSFLVSLFDIDITVFQHNSLGDLQYTPGWIFPILFCVSALVWLPLIIYALYWNDDSIDGIKKFLPGFKSNDTATSVRPSDRTDELKPNVEDTQDHRRARDILLSRLPDINFKRRAIKLTHKDEEAI